MDSIHCQTYDIHFNNWEICNGFILDGGYSKIFVLVDDFTARLCLPELKRQVRAELIIIRILSGEHHKDIHTCTYIWQQFLKNGGDRHSLCINLGGGVIGDMGGFCAATYMRGIDFIQIPTTLLSMVDASVGSKLGVDLEGVKNIVGLFVNPKAIFVFTEFLTTLPYKQILSGFAELLKHGLIADQKLYNALSELVSLEQINWEPIVSRSIEIKKDVVEQDPKEGGLRKILNFGHTIGHAIETLSLNSESPLLHGEAIAIGMVCESYLSYLKGHISLEDCNQIKQSIVRLYGHFPAYVPDFTRLESIMKKDKKNRDGRIHFSLLKSIGEAMYDVLATEEEITQTLNYYRLH